MQINPALLRNPQALIEVERDYCERRLTNFFKCAWSQFEAAPLSMNWHLEGIAEHLEAVSFGHIRRLLITVPPRSSKTSLVSICWPAWTWAQPPDKAFPLTGPGATFLCVSYGSEKAQEDAVTARRLIASEWYKRLWADRVAIRKDRDSMERYDTEAGGSRISVGIGASVLGRGGNIKIIDDPMKPDEVEGDLVRERTIRAYDETLSSRENDPTVAAEVIVAQRLHQADIPGHVIEKYGIDPYDGGFVHLNIPAEFDQGSRCETLLGWRDPRTKQDESFWPGRFTPEVIRQRKIAEGAVSWAAKYNQSPVPRGGGVIKPDWWKEWPPEGEEKFWRKVKGKRAVVTPPFEYVCAYLDTALTTKETNDPSGMVVCGTWRDASGKTIRMRPHPVHGESRPAADDESMLMATGPRHLIIAAWTEWLDFNQLLRKTIEICRKHRVDRLIIEAKTAGIPVATELKRLLAHEQFGITLENPKGDKNARLQAVSHMWEAGLVYKLPFEWAEKVVRQCEAGSQGKHDELADCMSGIMRHLRNIGEARTDIEHQEDVRAEYEHTGETEPLYDV